MKVLVGNTGLVGKSLSDGIKFDINFNTSNISDFEHCNLNKSELYLSCLPASKWLVNKNIKLDIENINYLIKIFSNFEYSKIFLISTIDVYSHSPLKSNEDYSINFPELNYGTNRLLFEKLVSQILKYDDIKIFRLPALYNKNIKKNILYDLINNNNVENINANSSYQWYNLDNICKDIDMYTKKHPEEKIFNFFTEPLETFNILNFFPHQINKVKNEKRINYDFTTKFSKTGYISNKEDVLNDIEKFLRQACR